MKFLFFIFFILQGITIFVKNVESLKTESIKGGNTAPLNHPYTYHASVHKNGRYKCGAALVHEKFSITTARCVIDITTGHYFVGYFTVVAGTLNVSNNLEARYEDHVRKIYTHKTYIPTSTYASYINSYRSDGDLALLKMQTGFNLTNNSKLSKLEISGYFSYMHHILIVTGNGYNEVVTVTNPFSNRHIDIGIDRGPLRYAEAQVIEDSYCTPFHDHYMTANHICARTIQRRSDVSEGVCMDDNGSPLVYDHKVLVGILIVGHARCDEKLQPAIYINVAYYWPFIQDILADKKTNEMRVATWKKRWGWTSVYEYIDE